jgi:hypothetical protein
MFKVFDHIAVMAKNLKDGREPIALCPSAHVSPLTDLPTMFSSILVRMVKAKETEALFAATIALWYTVRVVRKNLNLQLKGPTANMRNNFL